MNFIDYFQCYNEYFWQWEEDGEVVSIENGSTIGYKTQIENYLSRLVETGLPPFGSILMAIAATNITIDNSIDLIKNQLTNYLSVSNENHLLESDAFKDAFIFLNGLSQIPEKYKKGKRRELVLQTIFSESHYKLNPPTSKGLLIGLRSNLKGEKKYIKAKKFDTKILIKDLRTLHLLLRKFPNPNAIINAIANIPFIEDDEIIPLENSNLNVKDYNDFIEELIDVPQTFQLGMLVKPIWAGFKIPFFNASPSGTSLGGVSDLSNKGNFDKLLVSEFANDDIVFMARLANNEALYLHREIPPTADKIDRILLLDVSLYAWGTPKILAFATYLAISKHPKNKNDIKAFAIGENYTKINNENIDNIIDSLQIVDASLNAANGLEAYFKSEKNNKLLEVFLLTNNEALKHIEVQKQLQENSNIIKYIITTDRDGHINFYNNNKNGRKLLQKIILPLEKLWEKHIPITEKKSTLSSPTVLIPLLLPIPYKISKIIPFENDVYIVANNCLLKTSKVDYNTLSKGAELVLDNIKANRIYEIGRNENDDLIFLEFTIHNKEIAIFHIESKKIAKCFFPYWKPKLQKEFLIYNSKIIYLLSNQESFSFNPDFETNTIEIRKEDFRNFDFLGNYNSHQNETEKYQKNVSAYSYLKNVRQVFISKEGSLFFNNHQLLLRQDSSLHLVLNIDKKENSIDATYNKNFNCFLFNDGSKIKITNLGYFELISSDKEIPSIFISAIIEKMLGVATIEYFAGNTYYFNNDIGKVRVQLLESGINKISVVKIIKKYFALGLSTVKELVDNAPQYIPELILPDEAKKMVHELNEIGAKCEIYQLTNQNPQKTISQDDFYRNFIAKFILHIKENAVKN